MSTRLLITTAVLLVLLPGAAIKAEVYRWVDDQGRVHYSDKRPSQAEAEDISDDLKPVNVDESNRERTKMERLFRKKTDAELAHEQQQQQQQQLQRQKHENQCERARRALKGMQGRVVFRRADGSEEVVSEKERERRAEAFRQQIQQHCPGAANSR
ncbi:DUF4124 domain-containing protein [Pseudomaricurvus alkylphenolicus]|uniref:DUF4124 domain-containing protein n=1 Tax=Pseudomaricurvus alkylphenolicus TaxID=1306991 RepID=UPI001420FE2A|nr:DUF4124 domain-containing protein [Pseudomaricurvus alkylphenolicus]NIB39597.1 DUF4124 domain-containing protein [Pseudomaricurvus alkylphenolicus]